MTITSPTQKEKEDSDNEWMDTFDHSSDESEYDPADFEENNNPTLLKEKKTTDDDGEISQWCEHLDQSDGLAVLRIMHQPKIKCCQCKKRRHFSCIHSECLDTNGSSCCQDVSHIFPHMAEYDHPAILHHKLRVILCTRCNIRSSIRQFFRHYKVTPSSYTTKMRESLIQRGLLGYINFGNTCYMNAVLQILGHCSPFTEYMVNMIPPGGWKMYPLDTRKTIIQMALDLRHKFSPIPLPYLSPWKIIFCVRSELPGFECFQQQDASEFLRNLLEVLDRDLQSFSAHYVNGTNMYMEHDENFLPPETEFPIKTAIAKIFHGVLENEICCHKCGYKSKTNENFMDFAVPIVGEEDPDEQSSQPFVPENLKNKKKKTVRMRKKQPKEQSPKVEVEPSKTEQDGKDPGYLVHQDVQYKTNLSACLDKYFQPSVLQGDNQYSCSKCKKHVDATKTTRAKELPEVVIIQLKRFRHTMFGTRKIGKIVEFPVRSIDFGRWTTDHKPHIYDLIGFVVHEGANVEFGHYVSFCRNDLDHQWYKYDDMNVESCDITMVAEQQPYILMYQKRKSDFNPKKLPTLADSPYNFLNPDDALPHETCKMFEAIQQFSIETIKTNPEPPKQKKGNPPSKQKKVETIAEIDINTISETEMRGHLAYMKQMMDEIEINFKERRTNCRKNRKYVETQSRQIAILVAAMEKWFKVMLKKQWDQENAGEVPGTSQ